MDEIKPLQAYSSSKLVSWGNRRLILLLIIFLKVFGSFPKIYAATEQHTVTGDNLVVVWNFITICDGHIARQYGLYRCS